ncbi:MAG: rod shape-determining protein MreC [Oscillibacter sp.]|nr:rod shape-determining protein MreC [Oscillibacter sp.]
MKNFLKEHGLWILFAGAVIAVAMAALSFFSVTSSPLVNMTKTLTSPFRSAYTAVATWFNDKQNYYRNTTALEEENAALRQRIAQMEEDIRQAELDSDENQRLRELLELREQRRDFQLEAALITEHAVSNWTSSLSLNKGTAHGVENGDCVIDETGALVGIVREVGVNWCTVLTIVDTDTSLGAQVFRTKDLALAVGDFSLMEENRLRLEYLSAGSQLLGGDVVQTSGLGGFYPSGLVIGTVDVVQIDDSGSASYAVLIPSVEFDDLTEVFIIKDFDIVT